MLLLLAVCLRAKRTGRGSVHAFPGLLTAAEGSAPALYTVVSAAAVANTSHMHSLSSVALLSARPDGPELQLLSLLLMANPHMAARVRHSLEREDKDVDKASLGEEARRAGIHARIYVGSSPPASITVLECTWHSELSAYGGSLLRLMCHADAWHALRAMQRDRVNMTLDLATHSFEMQVPFTTESIADLPKSARVSGCVDPAYWDGDRPSDFNEWAVAQQLVGVDRVYVADQELYRHQVSDQVIAGFVLPTHDWPHRYLPEVGRAVTNQTTYFLFQTTTNAQNFLCLHEHWYDEWVFVSLSTDEFFTFLPDADAAASHSIYDSMASFLGKEGRRNQSNICISQLCVLRPFYGPDLSRAGVSKSQSEPARWTNPNLPSTRLHYSTGDVLAVERFTQRYVRLPPSGSVRKCFTRPDWRLGTRVKVHGFDVKSCPPRLHGVVCKHGRSPAAREVCMQLCGFWGRERCSQSSCQLPRERCAHIRDPSLRKLTLMKELELAHFRLPPTENTRSGFRQSSWLRNKAGEIRDRLRRLRDRVLRPHVGVVDY